MRLTLERLEDRNLLSALLFVVAPAAPTDSAHFHDLASAVTAAASGDTIQIEPNSIPGSAGTGAKVLTLQGNTSVAPAALPQVGQLGLGASGNILLNLNLGNVGIANGATGQFIQGCLIQNLFETNGPLLNGGNYISSNTVNGSITLGSGGPGFPGAVNDVVVNNAFVSNVGFVVLLNVTHDTGALIQGNILKDSVDGVIGIQVEESAGVLVVNNTILLSGTGSQGIQIDNPEFDVAVAVNNNRVDTGGLGTGILTHKLVGHELSVSLAGNDLVHNKVGIDVEGDGGGLGTVDLGNGSLGSRGGNDFHGYTSTLGGSAAIKTGNGAGGVAAERNIFGVSNPGLVILSGSATVDASSPLSADQAFVQVLFNDMLGRSGSLGELNGWVANIAGLGRQTVASKIIHSTEGCQHAVAGLYAKLLGRVGTSAEEAGWVNKLVQGATLEQVMSGILASGEFSDHAQVVAPRPGDPDSDFVQALYILLLGREGSVDEVSGWLGNLSSIGRGGIAGGFLNSYEFRNDVVQLLYAASPAFLSPSFLDTPPNMLHRPVTPAVGELAFWSASSLDYLNIEAGIAGSGEFDAFG